MDSLIYILFISIFFPLLLMVIIVERKSRLPIFFMLTGIFASVFAYEINGVLVAYTQIDLFRATVSLAPITEELIKALPILFYAIVITDKREKLFTASMAIGIGFAVLENVHYLLTNSNEFSIFTGIMRGFGTGLMHGMCTLLVGFGISFVKKKKKIFFVSLFALLSASITYHAIFNMLVQSEYPIVGAILPIITYLPFVIWRYVVKRRQDKAVVKTQENKAE